MSAYTPLGNQADFFNPDVCIERGVTAPDAEPFSIVLPPPNVTGTLHTGHALMLVIEDIMTSYARMQGKRTLWLPGTDHAAIATQSKVEKIIEKEEGKRKSDLGREEISQACGCICARITRHYRRTSAPHGRITRLEPRSIYARREAQFCRSYCFQKKCMTMVLFIAATVS